MVVPKDMNWEGYHDYEPESDDRPGPGDDPAVQELEPQLVELLDSNPETVFYETQLAVRFEKHFFHWVTSRALKDLRDSGKIGTATGELSPGVPLRFYFSRRCRYWKRKAEELRQIVLTFSGQSFARALGVQGELMIDAGLPRVGFQPVGHTIRSWNGINWTETGHNLDRVFQRDELFYGVEIKNRLSYIPQEEFEIKLRMCEALKLIPLFIARMMPKTYIDQVRRAGGFSLIMEYQLYPVAHAEMAIKVKRELGLPVDSPARLQDSTLQRFLTWHNEKVRRIAANPPAT